MCACVLFLDEEVIAKGEMDVNQPTRMALRTASVITNKNNEGSMMGGGGYGKTGMTKQLTLTNLPNNNTGKKVT